MAENPKRNEVDAYDEPWIGNEPLGAMSTFSPEDTTEIPFSFVGRGEDGKLSYREFQIASGRVIQRISFPCMSLSSKTWGLDSLSSSFSGVYSNVRSCPPRNYTRTHIHL